MTIDEALKELKDSVVLGIDTLSGDHFEEIESQVEAWTRQAVKSVQDYPDLGVKLYGPQEIIESVLSSPSLKAGLFVAPSVGKRIEVVDCRSYLDMAEAQQVFGEGKFNSRKTSLLSALKDCGKDKSLDGVLSGTNTKTLIGCAVVKPGRQDPYKQNKIVPPLSVELPTKVREYGGRRKTLLMDVGGSVDSTADHMVTFGIVGMAYSEFIMGKSHPKIGLISNGSEASKGSRLVKEVHPIYEKIFGSNYVGPVEVKGTGSADDINGIFDGKVDVWVTDGFTGNNCLKMTEASLSFAASELKSNIFDPYVAHLRPRFMQPVYRLGKQVKRGFGAWCLKNAFGEIKDLVQPDEYNGTPFLGFKGLVFKSHGGASPSAMHSAIRNSYNFVKKYNQVDLFNFVVEARLKEYASQK